MSIRTTLLYYMAGNVKITNCKLGSGAVSVTDEGRSSTDAIHIEDADRVDIHGSEIAGSPTDGISIDSTNTLNITDSVSRQNRDSGYFIRDTGFSLDSVEGRKNGIGLELGEKAGGLLSNSNFTDNRELDIQYHRGNIVKIFNTEARNIQAALYSLNGILKSNSGWVTTRILNTTDIAMKARNILKLARWLGITVVSGEAINLAKEILL